MSKRLTYKRLVLDKTFFFVFTSPSPFLVWHLKKLQFWRAFLSHLSPFFLFPFSHSISLSPLSLPLLPPSLSPLTLFPLSLLTSPYPSLSSLLSLPLSSLLSLPSLSHFSLSHHPSLLPSLSPDVEILPIKRVSPSWALPSFWLPRPCSIPVFLGLDYGTWSPRLVERCWPLMISCEQAVWFMVYYEKLYRLQ